MSLREEVCFPQGEFNKVKMKKHITIGLVLYSLFSVSQVALAKQTWKIDFESAPEATLSRFSLTGGWTVMEEHPDAPRGKKNKVMAPSQFTSKGTAIALFNEGGDLKDLAMQARVLIPKETKNKMAGLIFKYRNDDNYFFIEISAEDSFLRMYKVDHGNVSVIAKASIAFAASQWQRIQIFVKENRVACAFNGERLLQVQDNAVLNAGKVGFIVRGGTLALFDNLVVVDPR